MKAEEFEDYLIFFSGDEKKKQALYLKYIKEYEDVMKNKEYDFKRHITADELKSDAVFAINAMFNETRNILKSPIHKIHFKTIFARHLTKFARENTRDNLPISRVIKNEFKGSKRNPVYKGYEKSKAVDMGNEQNLEDPASNEDYYSEQATHIRDLVRILTPDENSIMFEDLVDHYVHGKSFREIAEEDRNKDITKEAVRKRMNRYVKKINKSLDRERKYDV